jgi:hypothetical protein
MKRLENVAGVDAVFYAWFMATIAQLTAANLAALAIEGVGKSESGRDEMQRRSSLRWPP